MARLLAANSFGSVEYAFGDQECVNRVYKIANLTELAYEGGDLEIEWVLCAPTS